MRLCCFFVTDGGHQVALNPKIVTRIHEMASKDLCVVYTNDGHQAIQVRGNFDCRRRRCRGIHEG